MALISREADVFTRLSPLVPANDRVLRVCPPNGLEITLRRMPWRSDVKSDDYDAEIIKGSISEADGEVWFHASSSTDLPITFGASGDHTSPNDFDCHFNTETSKFVIRRKDKIHLELQF